jgi:hypothetical protein
MTNCILCCLSALALVASAAPTRSFAQAANDKPLFPPSFSRAKPPADDCESRIAKLDASQAEGEERLAEKQTVIEACARQYKSDRTIARLVQECAKYEKQPVVEQQFVADCQLAAFSYANALYTLRAEASSISGSK